MEMLNEALSGMQPAEIALGAGFVAVLIGLAALGAAAWFFVSAVGYFKMFKKANQRGWFAFIPLLREYAMFKMSWNLKAFLVNVALLAAFQFTGELDGFLVGLVAVVCGIAWIVIQVKLMVRMAKAFGKGKLWAALLFFFPFITTLILGFGKAEYLGVPEEKKQQDPPSEA